MKENVQWTKEINIVFNETGHNIHIYRVEYSLKTHRL